MSGLIRIYAVLGDKYVMVREETHYLLQLESLCVRYIDFNLFFRFILIFQKYTDEVDDLLEALVGGIASLPGLLLDSRSQKTSKSYFQGFRKWKEWANSNNLGSGDIFPAKVLHVAIYLAAIIQTANSSSPVIHAFYSLKWVHNIGDQISPT